MSLPLLLLLFVGSGCAALIYEVVWLQLLQLVIGSSAVSLGVLLGTFMGGMCLGSLFLPRYVSPREHPLRVYAWLELGIGAIGLLVLFAVPLIGRLYALVGGGQGFVGFVIRGLMCAICLLPPTILMGATLPAIARWIGTSGTAAVSWLGFFYGANIAGAVAGCLAAGFYLLRVYDMATATYVAVAINVLVGAAGLLLAKSMTYTPAAPAKKSETQLPRAAGASLVYVSIAMSGLCALGSEVIWTRILSLLLGATTYTFSIILAVFLTGLGIGTSTGSFLSRAIVNPRVALAWCQLLAAASIGWTAWVLGASLPYWPVNPWLSTSPWFNFQLDIVRCMWAMLPASILWGASFPLALAGSVERGQDPGKLVGGIYAANTVGAIAGAIAFSVLTVPFVGTHGAQRILIALSALSGIVALVSNETHAEQPASSPFFRTGPVAAVAVLIAILFVNVPPIPTGLVAYGRSLPTRNQTGITYLYKGEGLNSSVAVSELPGGVRNFHVSGKVEASSEPQDMRLQRMLGNIPAVLHPNPRSVLIVGFGAGVTSGSFVPYVDVERIVICEIEPLIPTKVAPFFARENYSVLRDPRATVVYDDARHQVLTMDEKFDIITSDPIHPWVKGAATLYTREYFELVKQHLKPGGLVTQWVPLYESSPEVVKSEVATFFEVFPDGTVWANLNDGEGYDVVLLGKAGEGPLDLDAAQQRLLSAPRRPVVESLREVGFNSLVDLLATYAGHARDLRPWLDGAIINRDRNLRLQYLAGMQLNLYIGGRIYGDMVSFRQPPGDHFIASPELRAELRRRMGPEY